ncbi:MAG: TetR/AcrR family transcriptional regulator [Chloroflexi bacterium]|nr:TetR/AcrR family transcriptional regulator [Chloroflexota bacterium]
MPRKGVDRTRITAAAAEIADEHGLQAVTLQAIASILNVKSPSLYSHVENLDDVHRELALLGLSVLTERLTQASIGKSGLKLLRSVCLAQMTMALERPGLYAASVAANRPGDDELNQRWQGPVNIFTAVIDSYGISGDEASHAMRVLRTSVHGFALVNSIRGFRLGVDPDETFERLVGSLHRSLSEWDRVAAVSSTADIATKA